MYINIPETNQKRVVVIGAGFAGLSLARKLAKSDFQVVLIDKNNYHQFQPLFYQVAMAGLEPSSIAFPLRKIFQKNKNVFVRVTKINALDTGRNVVLTEMGDLEYDYVVLAIGAKTNFFGNEQIAKKAISMKSVSEALFLRNLILANYEQAVTTLDYEERQGLIDIVIVGGGPTGVEVAGALAEMKKYILPKDYKELDCEEVDIYLIQSSGCLLKGMSENASKGAEQFLTEMGVNVKLNTRVEDFDGDYVHMNDGTKIRANKVIWAAGIRGNTMQGLDEDVVNRSGRIKVDLHNKVKGTSNVFAIGDVAVMESEANPYGHPQVAQVAIQQGRLLAKNLKKGSGDWQAFKYNDKGSMATIGRNRAVCDLPRFKFKGFFAWLVWLVVHLFSLIGIKNKVFVFLNWFWNYFTYDQSLRLIIKPELKHQDLLNKQSGKTGNNLEAEMKKK